jgi:hypothetical protein
METIKTIHETFHFLVSKLQKTETENQQLKKEIKEIADKLKILSSILCSNEETARAATARAATAETAETARRAETLITTAIEIEQTEQDRRFAANVSLLLDRGTNQYTKSGSKERIIAVMETLEYINQYEHIEDFFERHHGFSQVVFKKLNEYESGPCSLLTNINRLKKKTKTTQEVSNELDLIFARFEKVKKEIRSKIKIDL